MAIAQQLTKYLLITLVLSLGFGQLLRFSFYGVPLYLHDILVCLVLLLLFLQGQALKVKAVDLQGLALLGAGLSLGWLYAFFIFPLSTLLVPGLYTLRLLAYIALYLLLRRSKFQIPHSYFLLTGFITLLIGYLQYFILPDMRVFQYLGWDDHLNRLTLPHFDPTFTGVMLGLALLSTISTTSNFLIPLSYLIAIFFTYSRSIWFSLFAVGLVYAIQTKKYAKLLLAVTLLGLMVLIQPKKFGEGTNLLRIFSVESRVVHDLAYLKKYNGDLLIGRGMNTLIIDTQASDSPNHATGPNSSYLYLLLTSGVLGLIGWGMFMYGLYRESAHKSMLIFFFVASLFNNVMFYPFALLWVLLVTTQKIE